MHPFPSSSLKIPTSLILFFLFPSNQPYQSKYLQSLMENEQKFASFLRYIQQQSIFPDCIRENSKRYEINAPELSKLPPSEITRLRKIILDKRQAEQEFKQKLEVEWNQCEKKIFNWLALALAKLHNQKLENLKDEDLLFLSEITTQKSLPLIKYQLHSLIKLEGRPKWSEQEDKILLHLLSVEGKFKTQGEWIHVSKELFLRGDPASYKSAKSCRERWFNHVDPALNKQWTIEEDLMMLDWVRKQGKRWASISYKLNHVKNQHMIKNRFYSLLKKAQKTKNLSNVEEDDLIIYLIKETKKKAISPKIEEKEVIVKQQQIISEVIVKQQQIKPALPIQESKEEVAEMKLLTSIQIYPSHTRYLDPHEPFIAQFQEMQAKLFQEQNCQGFDGKPEGLKLSQSLAYNISYPSPVPVTPGADFNLFNEHGSSPSVKGAFKFNFHDYVPKNPQ